MKKKIALLLAAVISMSAAPITTFAAELAIGGNISSSAKNIPANTLFPHAKVYNGGLQAVNERGTNSSTVRDQNIEYVNDGVNLVIKMAATDFIEDGQTFQVTLSNAAFWFAENTGSDEYINITNEKKTFRGGDDVWTTDTFQTNPTLGSGPVPASTPAESNNKVNVYSKIHYNMYNQIAGLAGALETENGVAVGTLQQYDPTLNGNAGGYAPVTIAVDDQVYFGYDMTVANASNRATATFTFAAQHKGASGPDDKPFAYGGAVTELRIPLVMKTLNEKDVKAIFYAGTATGLSGINSEDIEVSLGRAASGTTTIDIIDVTTTRTTAEIGTFLIEENVANQFKSGIFELELNQGFNFVDNSTRTTSSPVRVSTNGWGTATFLGYNRDKTIAYFENSNITSIAPLRGSIIIKGLAVRVSSDYYDFEKETATITVRSIEDERVFIVPQNSEVGGASNPGTWMSNPGNAGITERSIIAAYFNNYGLIFGYDNTTDKTPTSYAGRENIRTPLLRLQERAADSWWSDRTTRFTLTDADGNALDGVKIAKVTVSGFDNIEYQGRTGSVTFSEDEQVGYDNYALFNRGFVELRDLKEQSDYENARMNIQFTLNTAANFSGEVYVSVSGVAIDPEIELEPVKIAVIKPPVQIITKTTEVAIGYQTYSVADVTIREDAKGVLRNGKVFSLELDEFANSGPQTINDVAFNPITMADITSNGTSTLTFNKVSVGNSKINFAISRPSTKDDATGDFTIKNLHIRIDRSVPYGNIDLIAGGTAIAETYREKADEKSPYFTIKGVVFENYVKVATAGDSKSFSKNIVITPDNNIALVDGKEVTVEPAPYINDVGRVMIPLRAISTIFDIPSTDVIWDSATGTATVILAGTTNSRIVTFTNGSSTMNINGVPVAMVDEGGVATVATITPETGRMFIPWRQLGIAFGIRVDWDGSSAIFNPTPEQIANVQ